MRKRYSIWLLLISSLNIFLLVGCSAQKSINNSLEQIERSVQHSDLKHNPSERLSLDFVRHVDGDTSVFL
ncbi:thermonuclease family protein, partial [Enterococcus faecalis]|uniref:thermonuclease family protein n=1 Tax=Enterococcus faecalis TaxID=1351 RepID=UPI003D6C558A